MCPISLRFGQVCWRVHNGTFRNKHTACWSSHSQTLRPWLRCVRWRHLGVMLTILEQSQARCHAVLLGGGGGWWGRTLKEARYVQWGVWPDGTCSAHDSPGRKFALVKSLLICPLPSCFLVSQPIVFIASSCDLWPVTCLQVYSLFLNSSDFMSPSPHRLPWAGPHLPSLGPLPFL